MAEEQKCAIDSDKLEIMIAIGAATAVNCIPCFDFLYEKAIAAGLTSHEIRQSVDIADRVKKGAHIAIIGSIDELIGVSEQTVDSPGCGAGDSCCG